MSDNGLVLTSCNKCGILYGIDDCYDKIMIARKITYGYEWLHFCPKCGKKIHDTITTMLPEGKEINENE